MATPVADRLPSGTWPTPRALFEPVMLSVLSLMAAFTADQSRLWVDERITLDFVQRYTFWELIVKIPQHQPHLPTYYLFIEVAGVQVAQLVSLVAFPITVLATVEAGRELYPDSPHRATMAGYVVAVSPFLATQAGWLRMYAPLTALLTIGLWQALAGNYRRSAAVVLPACLLHPFAALPLAWLAALALADRDTQVSPVAVGLGTFPLAALLVYKYVRLRPGLTDATTGMTHGLAPGPLEVGLLPVAALVGTQYTSGQVVAALLLVALLAWRPGDRRLLAWIAIPIVGIVAASYLLHPVFQPKYFGFIAPAVALLIAQPRENYTLQYSIYVLTFGLVGTMWIYRAFGYIVTRYYRFLF